MTDGAAILLPKLSLGAVIAWCLHNTDPDGPGILLAALVDTPEEHNWK